jgi:hypothetical protein
MREQPGATADVDLVSEIANKLAQLACKNGPCWYIIVYWDAWYTGATIFSAISTLIQVRPGSEGSYRDVCVPQLSILERIPPQ